MGHALMMHEVFPEIAPRQLEELTFGDVPWNDAFERIIPQETNARVKVGAFALRARLPEVKENRISIGDRMRFAHFVIEEAPLADNPLVVLAVDRSSKKTESIGHTTAAQGADSHEEDGFLVGQPPKRTESIGHATAAQRVDSYDGVIHSFFAPVSVPLIIKRVLARDTVNGTIYSVSPKLLRIDS